MSDDRVRTFVKLRGRRAVPFQEYFVRGRARGAVEKIELRGIGRARPNPAVLRGDSQIRRGHPGAVESVRLAWPDSEIDAACARLCAASNRASRP